MNDAQGTNRSPDSQVVAPGSVPDVTGMAAHRPGSASQSMQAQVQVGGKPQPAGGFKGIAKQLIGIVLAAGFLMLAFRGINLQAVVQSIRTADAAWIAALVVVVLISHWLRAVRWVTILQPLAQQKISTFNSFCAVMYGYAVNIPIPRGGEVARVVSISKTEDLPWAGVVPTLLIDRLLDFALLVAAIGVTLAILPPSVKEHAGFLMPAGLAMCAATAVGLVLLPRAAQIIKAIVDMPAVAARLPEKLRNTALDLAKQFEQGTRSLSNPLALPGIAVLSVAIWFCYFLNLQMMLYAFHLQKAIDLTHTIIVWTIASVSVIAPTPGCVGTYHIATSKALNVVGGVDATTSLALVTLLHAVSFVAVPCVTAAVCFMVQNSRRKRNGANG